jgi:hypothetical protein
MLKVTGDRPTMILSMAMLPTIVLMIPHETLIRLPDPVFCFACARFGE